MSDLPPASRPCPGSWKWLAAATLASAVALAPVGCDPPPTAIPPGPTQIVAAPVVDKPLPPPTAIPSGDFEIADAGPEPGGGSEPSPGPGPSAGPAGAGSGTDASLVRDGGRCERAIECASGICEGQGCGADQKGVCMSRNRSCTRDLRAYCGCDGKTFRGSGSCPGRRFSERGACR